MSDISVESEETLITLEGASAPVPGHIPAGGTTNQLLAKASGDDYDTQWITGNTDIIEEGTNLYFTDARVIDALSGNTLTGDLNMGVDNNLILETAQDTQTAVGLLRLKFDDGEVKNKAKAIIAYVDENDSEVIWLQSHDWLNDSTQHKHFSIEAADSAGLKQTRLGVGYGDDIVDVTVNQANLILNRNSGETNGNIVMTGSGLGGVFRHDSSFSFYPDRATNGSNALQITLQNTDEIALNAIGGDYIYAIDHIMLNRATGGDYASLLRFGGETASNFQGGYIQYDAAGNEFIIGTHNTDDELNSSDIEVLKFSRDGSSITSSAEIISSRSVSINAASFQPITLTRFADNANGQGLRFIKARGSSGSPAGIQSGDQIARFMGTGYIDDGSLPTTGVHEDFLTVHATQNWTSTARGREVSFRSVPNDGVSAVDRLIIRNDGTTTITGALEHTGSNLGFFGATPSAQDTGWNATNVITTKTYDANATTTDELADVVGSLIDELKAKGMLGG